MENSPERLHINDPELFFATILDDIQALGHESLRIQDGIKTYVKGDASNYAASALTEADLIVQEGILKAIWDAGYDCQINGEESDQYKSEYLDKFSKDSDVLVSIDPIDGTLAYKNNLPNFCIVISVYKEGKLVGAMVHTPAYNKTYAACEGQNDSWTWEHNEKTGTYEKVKFKIQAGDTDNLITYKASDEEAEALRDQDFTVHRLERKGEVDENFALNSIFRGELAGYFRSNAPSLDWVPIGYIVEKAGGQTTNFQGETTDLYQLWNDKGREGRIPSVLVTTSAKIHQKVVDVLKK